MQEDDTAWAHDRDCGLGGLIPGRAPGQSACSENSNEGMVGSDR